MENYIPSFVLNLFSWNNQTPRTESELISNLRTNIKNFENEFAKNYHEITRFRIIHHPRILSSSTSINTTPTDFLEYCYDQGLYQNDLFSHMPIKDLDTFEYPHFLKKCQNARIDGYSALSTAMLAPNVSFEDRRKFIQEKLIKRNFKPTPKDIQLAKLIFYDELIKETQSTSLSLKAKKSKTKLMYILHPNFLFTLPQDLKQFIASFMIKILKKEENCWLLPGF
jgi:hypothetical protein